MVKSISAMQIYIDNSFFPVLFIDLNILYILILQIQMLQLISRTHVEFHWEYLSQCSSC